MHSPWGRPEDRTAQSSRPPECPDLWLPHPCKATLHSPLDRTPGRLKFASAAFDDPIQRERENECGWREEEGERGGGGVERRERERRNVGRRSGGMGNRKEREMEGMGEKGRERISNPFPFEHT